MSESSRVILKMKKVFWRVFRLKRLKEKTGRKN